MPAAGSFFEDIMYTLRNASHVLGGKGAGLSDDVVYGLKGSMATSRQQQIFSKISGGPIASSTMDRVSKYSQAITTANKDRFFKGGAKLAGLGLGVAAATSFLGIGPGFAGMAGIAGVAGLAGGYRFSSAKFGHRRTLAGIGIAAAGVGAAAGIGVMSGMGVNPFLVAGLGAAAYKFGPGKGLGAIGSAILGPRSGGVGSGMKRKLVGAGAVAAGIGASNLLSTGHVMGGLQNWTMFGGSGDMRGGSSRNMTQGSVPNGISRSSMMLGPM